MKKRPTTIRLDASLRKVVVKKAREEGLSFSSVVHLLLLAFANGSVQVGVTQYPKGYLEKLEKEANKTLADYKKGKAKGYTSAKEMFDDILKR